MTAAVAPAGVEVGELGDMGSVRHYVSSGKERDLVEWDRVQRDQRGLWLGEEVLDKASSAPVWGSQVEEEHAVVVVGHSHVARKGLVAVEATEGRECQPEDDSTLRQRPMMEELGLEGVAEDEVPSAEQLVHE